MDLPLNAMSLAESPGLFHQIGRTTHAWTAVAIALEHPWMERLVTRPSAARCARILGDYCGGSSTSGRDDTHTHNEGKRVPAKIGSVKITL
jgi:hypothetical protein